MKPFTINDYVLNARELIGEISDVSQWLWDRGWSEKSASNFSVNLDIYSGNNIAVRKEKCDVEINYPLLDGKYFYITVTGSRMVNVSRSPEKYGVIVAVGNNGHTLYQCNNYVLKASSELVSHLEVHNLVATRKSGEKVVLHSHATELIALTQYDKIKNAVDLNNILWSMQPGTMYFIPKGAGFVPYELPGTSEIAKVTRESFVNHDVVVWQKHGAFAIAKTLTEAFDSIDVICKSADIWLRCRAAGYEPTGLSDRQLQELKAVIK